MAFHCVELPCLFGYLLADKYVAGQFLFFLFYTMDIASCSVAQADFSLWLKHAACLCVLLDSSQATTLSSVSAGTLVPSTPPASPCPALELQICTNMPSFFMGARDLSSAPYARVVSTLSTKPCP